MKTRLLLGVYMSTVLELGKLRNVTLVWAT